MATTQRSWRGRHQGKEWTIATFPDGNSVTPEDARLAVLMDIREELIKLNRLLNCHNAIDIPNILRRIDRNTKRPSRSQKRK